MDIYNTSASSMSSESILNSDNIFDPGKSQKCSSCGRPLYWYGEVSNGVIISIGWHRHLYADNSYIQGLCTKCCQEHLENINKVQKEEIE